MGWVVGFEPTYTGATTLGLNHLTIPTMLANFVHYCVTASLALSYVRRYVPFGSHSACLVLRGSLKRVGDLERARTVDLQRDRLAF